MKKSLKDISWQVPEDTYRADSALSYSMLATYERGGFHSICKIFDRVETPSLTFGSAVDAIITGGMQEFQSRFIVCDYSITEGGMNVCKKLSELYSASYKHFNEIPQELVSRAAQEVGFWKDPKWDKKRYSEVLKTGNVSEYYNILCNTDKTVLDTKTFSDVTAAVKVLKSSEATKSYFQEDNPFENIQRLYQLKFKAVLGGIEYRCMMDECIVDYNNKIIYPIDLKTSSHYEDEFYKSFVDWNYQIQARLYTRILKDNLLRDDYFKDFEIKPYRFIVVNRNSLVPLVWEFADSQKEGTLIYGKLHLCVMRDPLEIGKELYIYLNNKYTTQLSVFTSKLNSITDFLDNDNKRY